MLRANEAVTEDLLIVPPNIITAPDLPVVNFDPPEIVRRHVFAWSGMHADTVQVVRNDPFEYNFHSDKHLLIASERVQRYDGETTVEGLPKSAARDIIRKLSFVPAGHKFSGWQKPRALARCTFFYIDPKTPLLDPAVGFSEVDFQPRLFFFDRALWETAMKLRAQVESGSAEGRQYTEALSLVLLHELMRVNDGVAAPEPVVHGGLAAWQQKRVADYIEEHLADEIPLAELAGLVHLSPFHFSRAFRQSFGTPPHRFHVSRRIERGKAMLADTSRSVTEVGMQLGFSETSAFTATFRKFTGRTPTDFRRSQQ